MKQHISVEKAIKRGHLIVNLPVSIIMLGFPALAAYLFAKNIIPAWGIAIGFILGFIIAWLIWSFMITKWRIWAFRNVRNVHELKKRAVQEKLIWKDGSIFEKTEIRTRKDKEALKAIEKRFEQDDVFYDDLSIPSKTEIYYSKLTSVIELIISVGLISIGIYFAKGKTPKNYILAGITGLIGIYNSIKEFRKLQSNEPQIIIDDKGIYTTKTGFKSWADIVNAGVIVEGFGKSAKSYLILSYANGESDKIKIDDLNISAYRLENLLQTYRMRYNKNNFRSSRYKGKYRLG